MSEESPGCPFCPAQLEAGRVFWEGEYWVGLWDGFPVTEGHALLVPRRHVAGLFEASAAEKGELLDGVEAAKGEIERRHPEVTDWNIGINVGEAAGQTVMHLHVHVIPRRRGDSEDPVGGVRKVVDGKGGYGDD